MTEPIYLTASMRSKYAQRPHTVTSPWHSPMGLDGLAAWLAATSLLAGLSANMALSLAYQLKNVSSVLSNLSQTVASE